MKKSRGRCRNSSFVSIRKAPVRKYGTNANEDEKTQTPILNVEALRTIGRIVRAIKSRIVPGTEAEKRSEEQGGLDRSPKVTGSVSRKDSQ